MIKLPTYKEIKEYTDKELIDIYWSMDSVSFSETNDKFFKKSQAVHSELIKRELGYFDHIDNFHFY